MVDTYTDFIKLLIDGDMNYLNCFNDEDRPNAMYVMMFFKKYIDDQHERYETEPKATLKEEIFRYVHD